MNTATPGDLRNKLILSVTDKLVFGLLIVLAGFVFNLVLENHRADQAMKSEIARLRVQKVADMWHALDQHQQAVIRVGQLVTGHSLAEPSSARAAQRLGGALRLSPRVQIQELYHGIQRQAFAGERAISGLKRAEATLTARLSANRFWIGERLYPQYVSYAARQKRLLQAYVNLNRISGGSYLGAIARSIDDSGTDAKAAQLRARLARGLRTISERRRQLDDARIDVFSAMEHMS